MTKSKPLAPGEAIVHYIQKVHAHDAHPEGVWLVLVERSQNVPIAGDCIAISERYSKKVEDVVWHPNGAEAIVILTKLERQSLGDLRPGKHKHLFRGHYVVALLKKWEVERGCAPDITKRYMPRETVK